MAQVSTQWPIGDGEMTARIGDLDWAATPLGPMKTWSERLKVMVEQVLANPLVSSLVCGPERILIYNDAAAAHFGGRHPAALGRPLPETFPEGWATVSPFYVRAFAGETVQVAGQPLDTRGQGSATDVFDALLVPVRDADGQVAAVHMTGFEVGHRARAEAALRESEELRRIAIAGGRMGTWRWDLRDKLIWGDAAFLDLWGFPPSNEPRGLAGFTDRMTPQGQAEMAEMVTRAIAASDAFDGQLAVVDGPSTGRWVRWRGQAEVKRPWIVNGVSFDVTDQHLADQRLRESKDRQAFLLRLSDALRDEPDADAVAYRAIQMLLNHLQLDRCYITYYRPADDEADFPYQLGNDTVPPLPAKVRLSDFPDAYEQVLDRTFVIEDDFERRGLSEAENANSKALGMRAMLASTIRRGERSPLASLMAVSSRPRRWSPGEIALVEETAERTWGAIERARAEEALRESEARLREFGEASQDVLWVRDAETLRWTYLTPAFETIYGISREAALEGDDFRNWTDMILPEDRAGVIEHIERVRAGERVTFEYRIRRPSDGEVRWVRDTDFPLFDGSERVQRIGGIGQDVTEEKSTAARMNVLVAELQHRTRNLMGVVRNMSEKTARGSADLPDYRSRFGDRLAALARVQGLLSRLEEWDRVSFDDLIRSELAVLDGEIERVTLRGPNGIALRSSTVQTFALAIHELMTNAMKYGALGQPQGHLAISWRLERSDADDRPWLVVDWRESGVEMPAKNPPSRGGGSGRDLIERALPYQLGAKTTFVMEADGVHCTIAVPVSERQVVREMADA